MRKPILFVCYPKCSTCQKAQKWLDCKGIAYEYRDIKTHNPTAGEIEAWRSLCGLPLKKFFNTSGNR
jgi:arsenate reductase